MQSAQMPEISLAAPSDRERFMPTITLAFSTDPLTRYAAPTADVYLSTLGKFMTLFGGKAFDHESAWIANEGQAVALWLPPGVEPDGDALMELLPGIVREDRLEDMFGVFEGMGAYHPHEEHWYLPLIGADPAYLGMGLGGALMKHACARIDEDGLPAYLESSNPRNISLYERHGFEVMGEIRSGNAPIVTPMYRAKRS
ncbi:GNAT family N-acetyltransferase [Qipengyuania sphaerica]|uniref:GNAT family N-acetyltransferase n=1 Tax=Qipengyuania sphaerica TaxID=2867243 RepID=UPI001C88BAA3|nr:GNAT family N-acetyltransferase [Qipengyuania sphaerica]MBX7540543.1 GNAT family N-acetyltransferase [Qipengyuania sphaerica]